MNYKHLEIISRVRETARIKMFRKRLYGKERNIECQKKIFKPFICEENSSDIVLYWYDNMGKIQNFPLIIKPEQFHQTIAANPAKASVSFVGTKADLEKSEAGRRSSFDIEYPAREGLTRKAFLVSGEILGSRFLLGVKEIEVIKRLIIPLSYLEN